MNKNYQSIIVIDDDEDARFMVRYQLQEIDESIHVVEFEDGSLALDFFDHFKEQKDALGIQTERPLVLLDINMPKVGGFDFLDQFQKLVDIKKVPNLNFIMYTSSDLEKDIWKSQCYDEVLEYIVKPISRGILERLVVVPS